MSDAIIHAPFTEEEWRQMRDYVNNPRKGLPKFISADPAKHYARWMAHFESARAVRETELTFAGLSVQIDPSVPDGMILVKDPRTKTILSALIFSA